MLRHRDWPERYSSHLCIAGPEAPLQLYGRDGVDLVGSPDLGCTYLAEPQVPDLAFPHQLLQGRMAAFEIGASGHQWQGLLHT